MPVFKCKMCGGNIVTEIGKAVGICDACGTTQTIPAIDDDRRADLFNRANHYRRNHEFDKAAVIYEQVLNEDGADAEAYWNLVLCKYGIEYVTDKKTRRYVPTYNRMQYASIYLDENYKAAVSYANPEARRQYKTEAMELDRIQRNILQIAEREDPFDVFICYKELDRNGERTPDSVLAQDIYTELEKNGIHTFFSRITLEGKLGVEYEPYIFAALMSAKVMLIVGTSRDNLNAPWVRNEWSRFSVLRSEHPDKQIIPVFKDMSPYDLPEELSIYQSQDMGKIGAIQDVMHGISKILRKSSRNNNEKTGDSDTKKRIRPVLKRAFICIEDSDFEKADELLDQVLNIQPELTSAYLGKLMVKTKSCSLEALSACKSVLCLYPEYKRAYQYASDEEKEELDQINAENRTAVLANAFRLLRSEHFDEANRAFEQLLFVQPHFAKAHVGMLMARLKIQEEAGLSSCKVDYSGLPEFQKAMKYANEPYRKQLINSLDAVKQNLERIQNEKVAAEERRAQAEKKKALEEERIQAENEAKRIEREKAAQQTKLEQQRAEEERKERERKKEEERKTLSRFARFLGGAVAGGVIGFILSSLLFVVSCGGLIIGGDETAMGNIANYIVFGAAGIGALIGLFS